MRIVTKLVLFLVFFLTTGVDGHANTELHKISDNVYAYLNTRPKTPQNSFGANAGVIIGKEGILVVDTLVSSLEAKGLIQAIRKVSSLPIKFVVNTHYHFDHVFGNNEFAKRRATIISHLSCKTKMEASWEATFKQISNYGLTEEDMAGTIPAYPALGFTDRMEVDLGDLKVELHYAGPSHTKGSVLVLLPQKKILFTGDLLFTNAHPYMGEADVTGWVKALDYIQSLDVKNIIPGHGPLSDKKDIAAMKEYLLIFDKNAKKLAASSTDVAQIVQEMKKVLPPRRDLESLIEANIQMKYMQKK